MAPEEKRVRKSLRLSFFDGIFASAMIGFTQEYFSPFLISIGATVRQISLLSAAPNLIASLVQIKSADAAEWLGSRMSVLNIFVLLQALTLIPVALLSLSEQEHVYLFIACVTLFVSFGAFATPAWGSMMSDLVPKDKRGEYFGWRTMVLGFTTLAAMFTAGFIIQHTRPVSPSLGFALIFGSAGVFRLISWSFLRRMYDPPLSRTNHKEFTFLRFLSGIRKDSFARFVASVSLMNFSVNLAAPFFAVLMIRDLGFSYLTYTVLIITASLTVYLTIGRWGKHADRVGNIKVIRSTSRLITLLPLLWVCNQNPLFLIGAQIFSGLLWAGFNLSASNFIYDAAPSENRTRSIAYFNVINGFAVFSGALLGGFLVEQLPPLMGNRIFTIFLLSSVLRISVYFLFITRLQEVRPVTKVGSMDLFFSIIGIRPLLGIERKTIRL